MLSQDTSVPIENSLAKGALNSSVSYADALENYRRNMDWWVVLEALDLEHAVGSAIWLSQKTGISVENTTEALEGLVVLGLLKNGPKGFEKIKKNFDVPWNDKSKVQKLEDHALISHQIMNRLDEEARGAVRFSAFASNIEIIKEMYFKIDKLILEAQEQSQKLNSSKLDNVYLISYTSVNGANYSASAKGDSRG